MKFITLSHARQLTTRLRIERCVIGATLIVPSRLRQPKPSSVSFSRSHVTVVVYWENTRALDVLSPRRAARSSLTRRAYLLCSHTSRAPTSCSTVAKSSTADGITATATATAADDEDEEEDEEEEELDDEDDAPPAPARVLRRLAEAPELLPPSGT